VTRQWMLDASPLILLEKIDFLNIMSRLADVWLIPNAVVQEIERKNPIQGYLTELSIYSHVEVLKPIPITPHIAAWDLGLGESEVLTHALERKNTGVIFDDAQARKCAKIFDLPMKGSLGIIIWAKKNKIIDNAKPYFNELMKMGLRIEPDIINTLIKQE